jgi:hypothetical protein
MTAHIQSSLVTIQRTKTASWFIIRDSKTCRRRPWSQCTVPSAVQNTKVRNKFNSRVTAGPVALCCWQTAHKSLHNKQERSGAGLAVRSCRTEQDVPFILSPSTAALSHRKSAPTVTAGVHRDTIKGTLWNSSSKTRVISFGIESSRKSQIHRTLK